MSLLRVLRDRRLAVLWSSQVLSAMGDYLYAIALLWIAVRVAGSGAGFVAAAETGAALLCGPIGGVFADRWNRRATMVATDLVRAAVVATLPMLAALGRLDLAYLVLVGIVLGALGTLFDPALQASIPLLAPDPATLQATNGLMDLTRRLARVLGPSLAGVLVAVLPLPQFFTLDALSFVISAGAIISLGSRYAWQPARNMNAVRGVAGIASEIASAARLIGRHTPIAWMIGALGIINGLWAIAFTLGVPLLTARALHASVAVYGLIVGAYGVGNVLANLVVGSLRMRHRVRWFFAGKIVLGAGFVLLAAAPTPLVALLGAAVAAVGGPMGDIPLLTMMQIELPAEQLGKAFSLRYTFSNGGALVGTLLAVPLFALVGPRLGIGVCALLMAATGVVGLARFATAAPQAGTRSAAASSPSR
jgi:DHA3 family macrolide efflux protein-like MFS transporter